MTFVSTSPPCSTSSSRGVVGGGGGAAAAVASTVAPGVGGSAAATALAAAAAMDALIGAAPSVARAAACMTRHRGAPWGSPEKVHCSMLRGAWRPRWHDVTCRSFVASKSHGVAARPPERAYGGHARAPAPACVDVVTPTVSRQSTGEAHETQTERLKQTAARKVHLQHACEGQHRMWARRASGPLTTTRDLGATTARAPLSRAAAAAACRARSAPEDGVACARASAPERRGLSVVSCPSAPRRR